MAKPRLALAATCPWRCEDMPPADATDCPVCACPITPGREHPECGPECRWRTGGDGS